MTVIRNRCRMLLGAVVRTHLWSWRFHYYGSGNRLLDACDGMSQTDEQVGESKEHKHHATRRGVFLPTSLMQDQSPIRAT